MAIVLSEIDGVINTAGLVFTRVAALMTSAPIFSGKNTIPRIRILLAILVTGIVLPLVKPTHIELYSLEGFIHLGLQFLLGITMGIIAKIAFEVFMMAGQLVAMQSGLGFARMMDPQSTANVPIVSQFYLVGTTLFFLIADGHLILIQSIVQSFEALPVDSLSIGQIDFYKIVEFAKLIFAGSVSIALPAIITLLLLNMTLAIITRTSPQLNIFSIGFPLTLATGLIVIYLTFAQTFSYADHEFYTMFHFIHQSYQ